VGVEKWKKFIKAKKDEAWAGRKLTAFSKMIQERKKFKRI
jgi:hypothetical protein